MKIFECNNCHKWYALTPCIDEDGNAIKGQYVVTHYEAKGLCLRCFKKEYPKYCRAIEVLFIVSMIFSAILFLIFISALVFSVVEVALYSFIAFILLVLFYNEVSYRRCISYL